jgi:hypothetical protein
MLCPAHAKMGRFGHPNGEQAVKRNEYDAEQAFHNANKLKIPQKGSPHRCERS